MEERKEKEMSGCNGTWKKRAIRWLNGMSVKEEKMKGEGFEEKKKCGGEEKPLTVQHQLHGPQCYSLIGSPPLKEY